MREKIWFRGAKTGFSPLQNIIQGFRMGRKILPSGILYFKRYKNPESIRIFSSLSHSHPFGSSRIAPRFPLVTSAW